MNELNIESFPLKLAAKNPDSTAFLVLNNNGDIDRKITFSELNEKVRNLSSFFVSQGWQNQRAVLLYHDTMDFIISFLACQCSGVIAVPVFFSNGVKHRNRIAGIINDAGASIILTSSDTGQLSPAKKAAVFYDTAQCQCIFTDEVSFSSVSYPDVAHTESSVSFIQYSSGSTGKPKGVLISMANLLCNQQSIQNTFKCNSGSVILSWLPFSHDMGLIGNILHAIHVGCTCILMSPFQFMQDPKKWLNAISRYKVTHSGGPNFAYDLCVEKISEEEKKQLDLSCWRVAYNGSEPVRACTLESFSRHFEECGFSKNSFYPCYGLAEATLLVTGEKIPDKPPFVITVDKKSIGADKIIVQHAAGADAQVLAGSGKVVGGMDVKVITLPGARECTELEQGEICISGGSVSSGYWNRDSGDAFVNIDGKMFLRTGDMGFFYQDELFVSGRLKEMMVVRGRNIYPYDIEQAVSETVDAVNVNGVAVFSNSADEGQLVVVAELTRSANNPADYPAIINHIEKEVIAAAGVTPFDIVLTAVMGIPKTTSGKLQRLKCKEYYENSKLAFLSSKLNIAKYFRAERNTQLKEIVLRTHHTEDIRRYLMDLIQYKTGSLIETAWDDSAELSQAGLDSIKAMEMINCIDRELNVSVAVSVILEGGSFGDLVNRIEGLLWINNNELSGKEILI